MHDPLTSEEREVFSRAALEYFRSPSYFFRTYGAKIAAANRKRRRRFLLLCA